MKDNCEYCKSNTYTGKLIWSSKAKKYLCSKCYQRINRANFTLNIPSEYGDISYDEFNQPICHICGEGHKKLMCHVRQRHNISAYEYKKKFGLETTKGIMCNESVEIARQRNKENYNKVVLDNLLAKGKTTRFKDGCKGRTKDQVSAMTHRKLIQNIMKTQSHLSKIS